MNVDLPNLTSIINSEGGSFYCPCSVTLESISEYWILIVYRYSKSSKCQSTQFIPMGSIEINFEYWLFDWFDFIHRCFFHSRWSCQIRLVIPSLDLHIHSFIPFHSTSFNDHWIFNAYSVCLFQTPYHHSLVIDLGSNHRLTLFHHHNPNWFS